MSDYVDSAEYVEYVDPADYVQWTTKAYRLRVDQVQQYLRSLFNDSGIEVRVGCDFCTAPKALPDLRSSTSC